GNVFNTLRSSSIATAQNQLTLVEYTLDVTTSVARAQYRTAADAAAASGSAASYPSNGTSGQSTGVYAYISTVPADAASLAFARNDSGVSAEFYVDNVSLKRLTLNPSP